jgi:hypothetical protein
VRAAFAEGSGLLIGGGVNTGLIARPYLQGSSLQNDVWLTLCEPFFCAQTKNRNDGLSLYPLYRCADQGTTVLKFFTRFAVITTVLASSGCYYHDYDRDDHRRDRDHRYSRDWDGDHDDRDNRKYNKRYRDDDRYRYYDNDRRRDRDDDDDDD